MEPYIYLRALRHVDYSVFSVSEGQKNYYDPITNTKVAFSSGQQVKRSIIDAALNEMGEQIAPVIFNYEMKKEGKDKQKIGEKEALSMADPSFPDQLLGGWMSAPKGSSPVKRRSPLSISAMRPLHPLLSKLHQENMTFDRSSHHSIHKVVVKDTKGNEIDQETLQTFLRSNQRTLPARKFLQDQKRTGGLFVYDIAIDLRTLFCVAINQTEPELTHEVMDKLKESGWKETQNTFGECLVCPKERRDKIIPALAKSLINWRITSNQSRTFSLMETLAIAISSNANRIAASIRAKLVDERKAKPVIDLSISDTNVFITPPAEAHILDLEGSATAIEAAEQKLIKLLSEYDYENQILP
ncbi:MAG: CRISPR-associated protein Cas7 [Bacteroidota bacterium]